MLKKLFCQLVVCSWLLAGCSSDTGKISEQADENTSNQTNFSDTSLYGKAGVIEKNPPVQTGHYIVRYPNGIVKMRGYYINGKRNGQWVSFFENGNIQSDGFFKNGLRDGRTKVYYENGNLYYEGFYKEGKEVGKWLFYDPSGKIIKEKNYDTQNP